MRARALKGPGSVYLGSTRPGRHGGLEGPLIPRKPYGSCVPPRVVLRKSGNFDIDGQAGMPVRVDLLL